MIKIRRAGKEDYNAIWEIFSEVTIKGDTYVFVEDIEKEDLQKHWFAPTMQTFVAEENGLILGTYILKPNHINRGSHVANASYMVRGSARGKGIGGMMCDHSLKMAKKSGFKAMQFNLVVATNHAAVKLWQKYGFRIIGTIPKGFHHKEFGLVDSYIMFREV